MPNGTSLNQSNILEYQYSTVFSTAYYHLTVSYGCYDRAKFFFCSICIDILQGLRNRPVKQFLKSSYQKFVYRIYFDSIGELYMTEYRNKFDRPIFVGFSKKIQVVSLDPEECLYWWNIISKNYFFYENRCLQNVD